MKVYKILNNKISIAVVISITALLFSCKNDIKTVNSIAGISNLPIQVAKNVEIIYSEQGRIMAKMKAPVMERYENERKYTLMPKGIEMLFYDSLMHVESKLLSKYAISYDDTQIMEAKNDVRVTNKKGEQFNSEHLIWDQKKEKIYSNEFIKITTADDITFADGFESDQYFNKYEIKKPRGVISLKK